MILRRAFLGGSVTLLAGRMPPERTSLVKIPCIRHPMPPWLLARLISALEEGFHVTARCYSGDRVMERRLAAILTADVKGYSRLMGADEVTTVQTLTAYRDLLRAAILEGRGRVVDSPGDNVLAEFVSVIDAVKCAVTIQERLRESNGTLPAERRMEFRIGINLGDIIADGERIYGDGVNVAARIEGLADGGGLCISGSVYDEVLEKLPLGWEPLGEQTLKNITRRVRVYRLTPRASAREPVGTPPTSPIDQPSIAVLAFANMSGDRDQEYFSDGIADDIITDLSKLSGLLVIARHSAFSFKSRSLPIQQIARKLGVRYVLEGSVRRAGDRVRITAKLIDAPSGHHVWAERYDRELNNIFDVQDDITRRIVTELDVKIVRGEFARVLRRSTSNLEAYDSFLRAAHGVAQATAEGNKAARLLLEEATRIDPDFAQAWAFLGTVHWLDAWMGWTASRQRSLECAELGANHALQIDAELAEAHATLGLVRLLQERHDDAVAAAERALVLSPGSSETLIRCAAIFQTSERAEEALPLARRAIRLTPQPPEIYLRVLGAVLRATGRLEESVDAYQRCCRQAPDSAPPRIGLAVTLELLGRHEEARAAVIEIRRLDPGITLERCTRTFLYKDLATREREIEALRRAGL